MGAVISLAAQTRPYILYQSKEGFKMADYRDALKVALQKMNDYYCEFGNDKDLQYTYGFFDAVAVIRELSELPLSGKELRKE